MSARHLRQIGLNALCCALLILAGCADHEKIGALQGSQSDLQNEIQVIRKQIKALDKIVLTLNRNMEEIRLLRAAESGERSRAQPEAKAVDEPQKDATEANTAEQKIANTLTREAFSARVVGITPANLVRFLGEPDNKAVKEGAEYWTYRAVPFQTSGTNSESFDIKIVFENEKVDRMVVMGDVRYGR